MKLSHFFKFILKYTPPLILSNSVAVIYFVIMKRQAIMSDQSSTFNPENWNIKIRGISLRRFILQLVSDINILCSLRATSREFKIETDEIIEYRNKKVFGCSEEISMFSGSCFFKSDMERVIPLFHYKSISLSFETVLTNSSSQLFKQLYSESQLPPNKSDDIDVVINCLCGPFSKIYESYKQFVFLIYIYWLEESLSPKSSSWDIMIQYFPHLPKYRHIYQDGTQTVINFLLGMIFKDVKVTAQFLKFGLFKFTLVYSLYNKKLGFDFCGMDYLSVIYGQMGFISKSYLFDTLRKILDTFDEDQIEEFTLNTLIMFIAFRIESSMPPEYEQIHDLSVEEFAKYCNHFLVYYKIQLQRMHFKYTINDKSNHDWYMRTLVDICKGSPNDFDNSNLSIHTALSKVSKNFHPNIFVHTALPKQCVMHRKTLDRDYLDQLFKENVQHMYQYAIMKIQTLTPDNDVLFHAHIKYLCGVIESAKLMMMRL